MYNKLNEYLSDINVMYVKLHNLHWNVVGSDFKSVHEYLEVLYNSFAEVYDSVAEIMIMQGQRPYASIKQYLGTTSIKEIESKDYKVKEVLDIVGNDIKTLRDKAIEIRSLAVDNDNYLVINHIESDLGNYDKTLWFINSMKK
ncbi:MAG: DNA starvation/stationary phase protection protein [Erysipelotrichaceae bacterium]